MGRLCAADGLLRCQACLSTSPLCEALNNSYLVSVQPGGLIPLSAKPRDLDINYSTFATPARGRATAIFTIIERTSVTPREELQDVN